MPSPARNKHQRQRHHHHLGERGQRGPRRRRRGQRHRRRSLLLQHPHPPRHLHSFPTRRSSDLPGRLLWHLHFQPHHRGLELHPQSSPGRPAHRRTDRPRPPRRHILRSEEHTSELQPRKDLERRRHLEQNNERAQRGPRSGRRGQRNRRR